MGLKKKSRRKNKRNPDPHAKGAARCRQALDIVATDNTFTSYRTGENGRDVIWIGDCLHCNSALQVDRETGNTAATIEHIVPTSAGGSGTDLLNLALACKACNNHKGVHHDPNYPRDTRAREVIERLLARRLERWRPLPEVTQ